jgi:hypothetical protein
LKGGVQNLNIVKLKIKTMKRFVFFLLSFLIVTSLNAQLLRFGVKGGVSSTSVKFDNSTWQSVQTSQGTMDLLVEQGDAKLGLHLGLFSRIQVLGFWLQPELLFTQSRGEFIYNQIGTSTSSIREQKFNKIDVPIIAGWKFGPARIGLGPVASIMVSESESYNGFSLTNVSSDFKKATFGYQVGVGLDIFKFATLDLKYEGNLSKFGSGVTIGGVERKFDQRNPQWIASLGIFF